MSSLKDELELIFETQDSEFFNDAMGGDIDEELFGDKGIIVTNVENVGGEGEGEEYYATYAFYKDKQFVYVRFRGYYHSYDGAYYDGYYFVNPYVSVTIAYK